MKNGKLVISLDFELLWGVFDKIDLKEKHDYFLNTRKIIPEILKLFTQYNISCTWATVGMLFNENWEEWEKNIPQTIPKYENRKLCAYEFGMQIRSRQTEKYCFAPDLIEKIIHTKGQELATHTYSHYYCSEKGQTPVAFKADLEKSISMAEKFGVNLKSLVFPRNQLNKQYLSICREFGIKTIRSNPENWYWEETHKSSFLKKVFRTGDAYLGFKDKGYLISEVNGIPSQQKTSRLLRAYSARKVLNELKLARIKAEMNAAARCGEVYHLWWHPHNFGDHPEQNLKDLSVLLQHYQKLNRQFGFKSLHMAEVHDIAVTTKVENGGMLKFP